MLVMTLYANASEVSSPVVLRHGAWPPATLQPAVGADQLLFSFERNPTSANVPAVLVVKLGTVTVPPL